MKTLTNRANSPLRYPGGKAKISQFVGNVLQANGISGTYIEPFSGGAGVAINLLFADIVDNVIINDLDQGVYSFWHTLLKDPTFLIERIQEVPFDYRSGDHSICANERRQYWRAVKKRYCDDSYTDLRDRAFDFFMLNRMNVSGVVGGGPIGGVQQNGKYTIASRFNKQNLISRIIRISDMRHRIKLYNYEATDFLSHLDSLCPSEQYNTLLFVDPPYFTQGRNLYNCYATKRTHALIAERLLHLPYEWILTYDTAPQINSLYPSSLVQKFIYGIRYSANKRGTFEEYLYSSPGLTIESHNNVHLELTQDSSN